MENTSSGDGYPELRINGDSMEKLRDIVSRREDLQDLISNKKRLKAIADEFAPASEEVKKQLEGIQKREQDIRGRLHEVNDDLEEQRFRCDLGEFSKEELAPIEKEMTEVQKELKEQIDVLEATYEECSRCLAEDSVATLSPNVVQVDLPPSPKMDFPTRKQPAPPPPPADAMSDAETTKATPATEVAKPDKIYTAKSTPTPATEVNKPDKISNSRTTQPASLVDTKPQVSAVEKEAASNAIKVFKKDGDPEIYPLRGEKMSIGRSPKSDIVIKLAGVSRTHAHVVRNPDGQYSIIDTSGGGGMTVNGTTQKKANLQRGDKITIASTEMEVVAG